MLAERKAEEKVERRKKLKDIREEERQNVPKVVDDDTKKELGDLDNPKTMPKVTDNAIPIENLCEAFKKLDVGEQGDRKSVV